MKNQLIQVLDSDIQSDVFYGAVRTKAKGKYITVNVSNHIKDITKKYEFRAAFKCRAGFVSIGDYNTIPYDIISRWGHSNLINVQVKSEGGYWFDVYTTKGGKWYSIDNGFLDVLTVGIMRSSFPDMCDHHIWEIMDAKTWADKAFTPNVMVA
jgi:hypothetical protein